VPLFDALGPLFGRTKLAKPDMDRIFRLSTAAPSLADAELAPDGRWGVCLQSVEGGEFARVEKDLRELVDVACRGHDFHARADVRRDDLGYTWVVFEDPDLEDGVTLVHLVGSTLQEQGYGEQLLAAAFRFRQEPPDPAALPRYLIYNYKRGRFYPFVPRPGHERDNPTEFRIGSALGRLLPIEPDLARWYPLWDPPL
jgi:hypothetical protein